MNNSFYQKISNILRWIFDFIQITEEEQHEAGIYLGYKQLVVNAQFQQPFTK